MVHLREYSSYLSNRISRLRIRTNTNSVSVHEPLHPSIVRVNHLFHFTLSSSLQLGGLPWTLHSISVLDRSRLHCTALLEVVMPIVPVQATLLIPLPTTPKCKPFSLDWIYKSKAFLSILPLTSFGRSQCRKRGNLTHSFGMICSPQLTLELYDNIQYGLVLSLVIVSLTDLYPVVTTCFSCLWRRVHLPLMLQLSNSTDPGASTKTKSKFCPLSETHLPLYFTPLQKPLPPLARYSQSPSVYSTSASGYYQSLEESDLHQLQ